MKWIKRIKNILISPKSEWVVIKSESSNVLKLVFTYQVPLILIACLLGFAERNILKGGIPIWVGLSSAVEELIQIIAETFIAVLVTDFLARKFSSEKNVRKSIQLVIYAGTPVYLSLLLKNIRFIVDATAVGYVYSIYLLFTGLPVLKNTPDSKVVGYLVSIVLVMIAIDWILVLLIGFLFLV